jgi:membrane protease YdiL (CAAX protease family)
VPAWTAFASVAGVLTALLLLLAHATSRGLDATEPATSTATRPTDSPRATAESDTTLDSDPFLDSDAASDSAPALETDSASDFAPADEAVTRVETDPTLSSAQESSAAVEDSPAVDQQSTEDASSTEVQSSASDASAGRESQTDSSTASVVESMSAGMVFANVALTHGLFGVVLVVAAVAAAVPRDALGVASADVTLAWVGVGLALGAVLYAVGEVGAGVAAGAGIEHSEELRELLAPATPVGWVVLLGGVLPVVAGFEEFLFRAVLVGAFAAGFDVPLALLVVVSSLAFGIGHGAQGALGVAVTTGFGVVLAVAFLATGSLLVVVIAHYVVNALEFVVHEGLGVEWPTHSD